MKHIAMLFVVMLGAIGIGHAQDTISCEDFQASDASWDHAGTSGAREALNISGSSHSYKIDHTGSAQCANQDFSAYQSVSLVFTYETDKFDGTGDDIKVYFNDGTGETEIADYNNEEHFDDNINQTITLQVLATDYNFAGSNEYFRIENSANGGNDDLNIDDICMYGYKGASTTFNCQTFQSNDTGWGDGSGARVNFNMSGSSRSYKIDNGQDLESVFLDFSAYESVDLVFTYYAEDMDNTGDDLQVRFTDGGSSATIFDHNFSTHFTDRIAQTVTVTVKASDYTFNGDEYFEIRNRANGVDDDFFIDDVCLIGHATPATDPDATFLGNAITISDGDAYPTTDDHTGFGSQDYTAGTVVRTYSIRNDGAVDLTIGAITIGGTNAAEFVAGALTPAGPIGAGNTSTFTVTFNPTTWGLRQATVSVVTDSPGENPYNFSIEGIGTDPAATSFNCQTFQSDINTWDADGAPGDRRNVNINGSSRSMRLDQNEGARSDNQNLSTYSTVDLQFVYYSENMESTFDDLRVNFNDGSGEVEIADYNFSTHFIDRTTVTVYLTVSSTSVGGPYNFAGSNDYFRIYSSANGGDDDFYIDDICLIGHAGVAEIDVEGNSLSIADGAAAADGDHADFGTVGSASGTVTRTFTIQNEGGTTLNLEAAAANRVTVSGADAADFTVTTQPSSSTIAGAGSLTFVVTFDPTTNGVKNATLTIINDEEDDAGAERPYNFDIKGEAVGQEMDVRGNSLSISNNDTIPNVPDHTNFGNVDIGGATLTHTYTIFNTGTEDLSLGGTTITGTGAAHFSISANPVSPVTSGGGTTTLGITFDPSSIGTKNAIITIPNDDPDENPYIYHISGVGVSNPTIDVKGNGISITQADSTPDASDNTSYGEVSVTGGSLEKTYTITNNGSATLNLGAITFLFATGEFTETTSPSATVAPGASTTVGITFNPTGVGVRSNYIYFANNDPVNPSFNFKIEGEGNSNAPAVSTLTCPAVHVDETIPGAGTIVNTYHQSIAGTLAVGADTVTIGASTGSTNPIVRGDLLLIIQMQEGTYFSDSGTNYGGNDGSSTGFQSSVAGTYEYVVALTDVTTAGGTLSITPTVNTYLNEEPSIVSGTVDKGRSRYQIIRVPRYNNLTIPAGTSITTSPWDGEKGGVVVLDVNGVLDMSGTGTIDVNELGFRGGYSRLLTGCGNHDCGTGLDLRTATRHASTVNRSGSKGEGIVGTPRYVYTNLEANVDTGIEGYPSGTHGRGAPGNAGGGGNDNATNNGQNSGGGGGSNGSSGGIGGRTWSSNADIGGFGAAAPGFLSTTRIVMGGGGGGGSRNNAGPSSGGTGGGIVFLKVGSITNAGSILANGKDTGATDNDGGGGGGAGGSVYISATTPASLAGLAVSAEGGDGATAWALQAPGGFPGRRHGPGGGGGGGVIYTNGALGSASVEPGNAGTTTTDGSTYGSTGRGDAGITVGINDATSVEVVQPIQATECTDLAVSVSTNGLAASPGDTVTFTITVTNNTASDATGVAVLDQLPNGYTYVSDTAGGDYVSGTGVWTAGTVSASSSKTITITATVNAGGGGVNHMNSVSLHRSDQLDTDTTNNSDSTGTSSLWLRADQLTVTPADGGALTTWDDQSGYGNDATASTTPDYNQVSLNFNPGITFNGTSDAMAGTGGYYSGTQIVVLKPSATITNTTGAQTVLGTNVLGTNDDVSGISVGNLSTVSSNELFGSIRGADDGNQVYSSAEVEATNLTKEILISRTNPDLQFGWELMRNSLEVTEEAVGSIANSGEWTNEDYRVGYSARADNSVPSRFYDGDVLEVISFQGRVSDQDIAKMNSYLALKYGITTAVNYINSEGATVYDVSTFGNRVFGVGRDDGTGLNQRQSLSEDDISQSASSLVTIGNKSILANTNNAANGNDLGTDESYFITGDDNDNIAFWTSTDAPTDFTRLSRVWKAEESGTINDSIRMRIDGTRLPAVPAGKVLTMIVADSEANIATADYTTATKLVVPMSKIGTNYECNHNFPSGTSYYTFAITDGCHEDLICTGTTTTWNGTVWSTGAPDLNKMAIIGGDYDTAIHGDFKCCKLKVLNTFTLLIGAGGYVDTQSSVTVEATGTLNMASSGSLVQYYDHVTNSGNIRIQRQSEPMYSFDYTYWSSPVTGFDIATIPNRIMYSYNNGWSRISNGAMAAGEGYIVMTDHTDKNTPQRSLVTFSGPMHNGVITKSVGAVGTHALVGNPYPCALDAAEFLLDATNTTTVNGAIYLWSHTTKISGIDTNRGNFTGNDYAVWNGSGGVASASGSAVPTGKIGSGQGFFIEGQGAGGDVLFRNCMRATVSTDNSQFFRPKSTDANPTKDEDSRLWLDLTNNQGGYKSILIAYVRGATDGHDIFYDANTLNGSNTVSLYSILEMEQPEEPKKLAIQGRALPFDDTDEIPLGVRFDNEGKHQFELSNFEGYFTIGDIYIEDKRTQIVHNLKDSAYEFETEAGEMEDRFVLKFKPATADNTLSIEDANLIGDDLRVSSNNTGISIVSWNKEIESVSVYNILGARLYAQDDIFNDKHVISTITEANQTLIVTITFEDGTVKSVKLIR